MKLIRILTLVFTLLFVAEYSSAQEIELNKYKFGEGLKFSGKDDAYKIEIGGFVQPYLETRKYVDNADPTFYNRYRMRRVRLQLSGDSAQEKLTYRLQLDLTGGGEVDTDASAGSLIFDAWVAYNITKKIKLTFGQKATPTDSRELGMRSNTLQLSDRSPLTAAFASIREFGFFAESNHKISRYSYIKPELAITNGDGINVFNRDRGGLKYGGRIDYLPFGLFNNFGQYRQVDLVKELTPKLAFGVNYSYNQGISDRRGSTSGTIIYLDANDSELLPDYSKFGIDFLFKYKGYSVLGEYINASSRVPNGITQRVRNDGTTSTSFDVNGIQDVTKYVNGRMAVGEGFNIQGGYVFKNNISIDGRFAHMKPEANSYFNNATFYNRSHYYTLGVTKFIARNYGAKIQLDCTYINAKPGSNGVNSTPINGDEILTRLITTISF
jgi:hypothetical protein